MYRCQECDEGACYAGLAKRCEVPTWVMHLRVKLSSEGAITYIDAELGGLIRLDLCNLARGATQKWLALAREISRADDVALGMVF